MQRRGHASTAAIPPRSCGEQPCGTVPGKGCLQTKESIPGQSPTRTPRVAAKPASRERGWPWDGPWEGPQEGPPLLAAEGRGSRDDVSWVGSSRSGAWRGQPENVPGLGGGSVHMYTTACRQPCVCPREGVTREAGGSCVPARAIRRGSHASGAAPNMHTALSCRLGGESCTLLQQQCASPRAARQGHGPGMSQTVGQRHSPYQQPHTAPPHNLWAQGRTEQAAAGGRATAHAGSMAKSCL